MWQSETPTEMVTVPKYSSTQYIRSMYTVYNSVIEGNNFVPKMPVSDIQYSYVWVAETANLHIYYIRNQRDATLAVLFINNCSNTLHVSDVYRVRHQEYINCSSCHWCMSWVGMVYIQ